MSHFVLTDASFWYLADSEECLELFGMLPVCPNDIRLLWRTHTHGYNNLFEIVTSQPCWVCVHVYVYIRHLDWASPHRGVNALGYGCYVFNKPTFRNVNRSDPGNFILNVRGRQTGSSITHFTTMLCNRKEFPLLDLTSNSGAKKKKKCKSHKESHNKKGNIQNSYQKSKQSYTSSAWLSAVFSRIKAGSCRTTPPGSEHVQC